MVSECPCEADKSVGDGEVLSLVEFVVHGMFAFGFPWVVFIVVIGGVNSSLSIGMVSGK